MIKIRQNLRNFRKGVAIAIFLAGSATMFAQETGVVINGVKWATRNLASQGNFVENPEDYGALFQWGRKGDGHEQRTSQNYPTNNNSNENGVVSGAGLDANGQIVSTHAAYGKFIKQNEYPYDWSFPQNNILWNSGTETTPVKTANDPCPAGWRVPTKAELQSLIDSGTEWKKLNGVNGRYFGDGADKLFLPAAGLRGCGDGVFYRSDGVCGADEGGYYWSSLSGINAWCLNFHSGGVDVYPYSRASGHSVRCVKDENVGINTISTETRNAIVTGYFDLLGRKLQEEPTKGLYIIRYDDGTSKKVMK
jgi:uncharacterized protein (TIGR02145 family)